MAVTIFSISLKTLELAHERRSLRVLMMVHELHKAGYQRLRIFPGISPSGCSWRCAVTPVTNILKRNGALAKSWNDQIASYSSADGNRFFGWKDSQNDTARQLASKFVDRFPTIARAGEGEDWAYVGWYVQMLGHAEHGDFPMAYADFSSAGRLPPPRALPTTRHWCNSKLPLPPVGLAEGETFEGFPPGEI